MMKKSVPKPKFINNNQQKKATDLIPKEAPKNELFALKAEKKEVLVKPEPKAKPIVPKF